MGRAVGIDLGTTNSVITAMEGGRPQVIPNAEGNRTTRSVAAFLDNSERLVGQMARRQAILSPKGTIYSAKRFIGRKYDDVSSELTTVSYDVVSGPHGAARSHVKGEPDAPEEISAQPTTGSAAARMNTKPGLHPERSKTRAFHQPKQWAITSHSTSSGENQAPAAKSQRPPTMTNVPETHSRNEQPITVVRTRDAEEAEELITQLYLPNVLELPLHTRSIDMNIEAVAMGDSVIGRLRFGGELRQLTDVTSNFHVNAPIRGAASSRSGGSEPVSTTPGQAAVFSPGRAADIEFSDDCVQICLMTPPAKLELELEELLGRSLIAPLHFDFEMSLTTPEGRSLQNAFDLVSRELDAGYGVIANPVAGRHLERLILDGLLLGQHHNYSDALLRPAKAEARGPVMKAVELLHDRYEEPWSTPHLARAVHSSVRSLQAGFARQVGSSPMAYLREVRLHKAHQRLLTARPGGTTVEAVATACGFVHLGRFAAAYRAAFGELPATTLRRGS